MSRNHSLTGPLIVFSMIGFGLYRLHDARVLQARPVVVPISVAEIGDRVPASVVGPNGEPKPEVKSSIKTDVFSFVRKVKATLKSKPFLSLSLKGKLWLEWKDSTHAKASFELDTGRKSSVPFVVEFKSPLEVNQVFLAEVSQKQDEDEVNILKDLIAAYAFENTIDTTGTYKAKFTPLSSSLGNGRVKTKLAYIAGSSKMEHLPTVVRSQHILKTEKTGEILSIEGVEETRLSVEKDALMQTRSQYQLKRINEPVKEKQTEKAGTPLHAESLQLKPVLHTHAYSMDDLMPTLSSITQLNRSERLGLFHQLVKTLKNDPAAFGAFKTWLNAHLHETGVLKFGIGVLATTGSSEAQKTLLEIYKSEPESQHTVLNALSTTDAKITDETRGFLRETASASRDDLSLHAALAMGASLKTEGNSTDTAQLKDLYSHAVSSADQALYLDAMGNSGRPEFKSSIEEALGSKDEGVREKAAFSARFMKVEDAKPLIERAYADPSLAVQQAAVRAITYQADRTAFQPLLSRCAIENHELAKTCSQILQSTIAQNR